MLKYNEETGKAIHNEENVDIIFKFLILDNREALEPQDANFVGSIYNYYMKKGFITTLQFGGILINYNKYQRELGLTGLLFDSPELYGEEEDVW